MRQENKKIRKNCRSNLSFVSNRFERSYIGPFMVCFPTIVSSSVGKWRVSIGAIGTGHATTLDEFSEKFQTAFNPLADFPAVFFHISHWYLSWNTAGGGNCI